MCLYDRYLYYFSAFLFAVFFLTRIDVDQIKMVCEGMRAMAASAPNTAILNFSQHLVEVEVDAMIIHTFARLR